MPFIRDVSHYSSLKMVILSVGLLTVASFVNFHRFGDQEDVLSCHD